MQLKVKPPDGLYEKILTALRLVMQSAQVEASFNYSEPHNARAYQCSVDGCTRLAYAKGLCNGHYMRKRGGKNMDVPLRAKKRDDKCIECGEKTGAKGGWGYCRSHYKMKRLRLIKDTVIAVMGGQCWACGNIFPRCAFDFHHIGVKESHNPSMYINNSSIPKIAKELSNCILLCANCHREEHSSGEF